MTNKVPVTILKDIAKRSRKLFVERTWTWIGPNGRYVVPSQTMIYNTLFRLWTSSVEHGCSGTGRFEVRLENHYKRILLNNKIIWSWRGQKKKPAEVAINVMEAFQGV